MPAYGELPCPKCAYTRGGLEHTRPCPECGAPGFRGDLIVSGQPETHAESRWAGRAFTIAYQLIVPAGMVLTWWLGRNHAWEEPIAIATLAVFGVGIAIWLSGRYRRTSATRQGVSLEQIVWEFEQDGVRVREFDAERFIPYADVVKVWSQLNFAFSRKARVTLELRSGSLRARQEYPVLMIAGTFRTQRTVAEAIKARVAAARRAS
jgi:hypothetical protein